MLPNRFTFFTVFADTSKSDILIEPGLSASEKFTLIVMLVVVRAEFRFGGFVSVGSSTKSTVTDSGPKLSISLN